MQQLEMQYFFPLTEQIELDLDFTESEKYDEERCKKHWHDIFANSMPLWVKESVSDAWKWEKF